jgi:predicted transcriptional regulator of viral defense system
MKQSSLNQSQLGVLENALIRYGNVVTFTDLSSLIPTQAVAYKRQFVKQMVDSGWLVRIKKGLYQISDLSSLGMLTLSRYCIAQLLVKESYVSTEAALEFHGMYDQLPSTVTSVALKQYSQVNLEGIWYQYIKTTDKFYFGWQEHQIDGRANRIATPEKALIDLVQFHRSRLSVNLVAEKLAVYREDLDTDRLFGYLLRSNLATLRIFGLLLDTLGVDTQDLWDFSRHSTTVSRLTSDSGQRNSRWHLYYDTAILAPIISHQDTHVNQ